ncbi:MAG: M56 family metallopeptidase [Isosphaeraceae bacterium]
MLAWMDRIWIILFDASLSTAVFTTFIVLVMLACRQPARRILVARVALLSSLAIVPLVGFGRLPRLDVLDTLIESRFFPRSPFLSSEPRGEEAPRSPSESGDWEVIRLVPSWVVDHESAVARWLPRGLTFVDLACVGLSFAWLILGVGGVQWVIGRSRPASPSTLALFEQLVAGRSGAARSARLRVSARLRHPVVAGLLRPTILIPEALDREDADLEPLRLSLLHEIAHAEQSDHWFSTIAGTAQAIWFFLPQMWWIRSRLMIDQEFLADRSAADRYGTSSEYASSLLSLAVPRRAPRGEIVQDASPASAASASGTIGVQSPLFQRVLMLLHCPYPVEVRTPRLWSWTSRVGVVVASVLAACLVIRWPQASFALPPTPLAVTGHRSRFQVNQFVAQPIHESRRTQRSLVYVLPLTLPATFDLEVDVQASLSDLASVRIAGIPLDSPRRPLAESLPADALNGEAWWHVRMHRDHRRITLAVEGRDVPVAVKSDALANWLTIEPPADRSVAFHKLVVTW